MERRNKFTLAIRNHMLYARKKQYDRVIRYQRCARRAIMDGNEKRYHTNSFIATLMEQKLNAMNTTLDLMDSYLGIDII